MRSRIKQVVEVEAMKGTLRLSSVSYPDSSPPYSDLTCSSAIAELAKSVVSLFQSCNDSNHVGPSTLEALDEDNFNFSAFEEFTYPAIDQRYSNAMTEAQFGQQYGCAAKTVNSLIQMGFRVGDCLDDHLNYGRGWSSYLSPLEYAKFLRGLEAYWQRDQLDWEACRVGVHPDDDLYIS